MNLIYNIFLVILITHLSSTAFLFVEKTHRFSTGPEAYSKNPLNPFREGNAIFSVLINLIEISYFQRNNLTEAPNDVKYVDAIVISTTTLAGCSYGDVSPRSFNEIIWSLIIFLVGALILAKVFGDFAALMHLLAIENTQKK